MIVPLVSASGRPGNDRRDISASSSGNVNVSGVNYERPIVSALRRFYRESWGVPWPNASIFAEQSSFMIVYVLRLILEKMKNSVANEANGNFEDFETS